jgi:sugar/nucleoside kinase (ribokinase family)
MAKDIVVLGNLMVDDLVFGDGSTRMAEPGGAAIYAALGASLWGLDVGVVSIVGTDYPQAALAGMAARGIDLGGVHPLGRPGVRLWALYEERLRQLVHRRERPAHTEVSPGFEQIPEAWRSARAFHVSPMPFETQSALVRALAHWGDVLVSVDPWLPVDEATWQAWRNVLADVDAFFVGVDELRAEPQDETTLRRLAAGRLRHVAFKRGAEGGLLYDAASKESFTWQPRAAGVVDPTGAGDAFATGTLAGLLRGEPIEKALRRGVVGASFALESYGPHALLAATPAAAQARLEEWFGA